MKYRSLTKNNKAISMMFDAIFFVVLVSLSGAVLLPALQGDIAINSSVDKHREEIVDESLLMVITSRDDRFEYTFAGTQINSILGGLNDDGSIIHSIIDTVLGREMHHKTYGDLLSESLASQLKFFDYRINIFTEDYDEQLKNEITNLLEDHLGDKYDFNLTVKWHPIMGLPFGGDVYIGDEPPDNTHVAKSYLSMPDTVFSNWWKTIESYIQDEINAIVYNSTTFNDVLKSLLNTLINNTLFDGFNDPATGEIVFDSILNVSIDYVFYKIHSVFDETIGMITESVGNFGIDFDNELYGLLIGNIKDIPGVGGIGDTVNGAIDDLKNHVSEYSKDFLHGILDGYINCFVEGVVNSINSVVDLDLLNQQIIDFFTKHVNVLRSDIKLTIWEVRG